MTITTDDVWRALQEVMDPEIPVVSVVEMGIIRAVEVTPAGVIVTMTPTFSGCPALDVMRRDVAAAARALGVAEVTVETVLHPPWSTEWISAAGREKLRRFGLAPPPHHAGDPAAVAFFDLAECPRCGSNHTSLRNAFGPTLCRMIWYCHDCRDAFEQFKPL
ncbi:Phenylacetate-CoA oxygenase, PaaJ subunit [Candidatus Promineifilum breve]|uniref:Phenylacetate-CoA oxygenase, PaaJ subunit n=1 Tax=Candidatus Promineifilum breve TaxID=1806508 RepID=A0A160T037_9CHLR|nr:1,2-phenylacetyl-CoA epoxidase subunit PaaD [Candidatus Promineifilum breve]CUS02804.2 Phenylacetate-CoA oxygenase, PaaJ subunit [Candidatus Promineifilum breve]